MILSVLGCAAGVVLWGWNRGHVAHARLAGEWNEVHVVARPIGIYVGWARLGRPQSPRGWAFGTYAARREDEEAVVPDERGALGFRVNAFAGTSAGGAPCAVRYLVVPHWFVAAAALVIPAAGLWREERRLRRWRRARCPRCGYDLRATPGQCPECGRPSDVLGLLSQWRA
jgi:hypothetical protein